MQITMGADDSASYRVLERREEFANGSVQFGIQVCCFNVGEGLHHPALHVRLVGIGLTSSGETQVHRGYQATDCPRCIQCDFALTTRELANILDCPLPPITCVRYVLGHHGDERSRRRRLDETDESRRAPEPRTGQCRKAHGRWLLLIHGMQKPLDHDLLTQDDQFVRLIDVD